jgi:hypothetical protein
MEVVDQVSLELYEMLGFHDVSNLEFSHLECGSVRSAFMTIVI